MAADVQKKYTETLVPPWVMEYDCSCWEQVEHLGLERKWGKKDIIFDFGDAATEIILIRKGLIRIVASGWNGNLRNIGILGPGSLLGETAFFKGCPYQHSVFCVENSTGIVFSGKTVITKILPNHPALAMFILRNLARKSYMMSNQLESESFLSSEQKIANFLYHLGLEQKKGSWIYSILSSISLTTLAEVLGLHRVTTTKTINGLKKDGVLCLRNNHMDIKDMDALVRILYAK